jgi:hypothetical protein
MPKSLPDKQAVLDAIRRIAQTLGHPASGAEFKAKSRMTDRLLAPQLAGVPSEVVELSSVIKSLAKSED